MRWFGAAFAMVLLTAGAATAQPYDGPPPGARYWEVPAFVDYPYQGPARAVGALYWSHGLSGTAPQYQFAPPPIILEFAKKNWDIIKVQRNPEYEVGGWSDGGERHVADLLERVKRARTQGYRRVIVAGQSYGGAISIEAGGRTDQIFGVLAFAPGHGSDACGGAGQSPMRVADMLASYLMPAVDKLKLPRVVVSMAEGDECLGGNRLGPRVEETLRKNGLKYIHFDGNMPIRGHGAAGTSQFGAWYRDCLIEFMTPEKTPTNGRTVCPTPANTRFLTPASVRLDAPSNRAAAPADLAGPWLGAIKINGTSAVNGTEVCVVIDKASADELSGNAYFGSGPAQTTSMSTQRFVARKNGNDYVHTSGETYRFVLAPKFADGTMALSMGNMGRAQFTAALRRGCT